MACLSLNLLGGVEAWLPSGDALTLPTRKAQALLAYLALPAGQAHPRDKLAALLWGGIHRESARASLRQALFSIRKSLAEGGAPALLQGGEALALDPKGVEVDAAVFERSVNEGTPLALERAEALYRGDLLAGLALDEPPFEDWLLSQRERLSELALEGIGKLLAHQRRAGETGAAVRTALKLLTLDPLHEPVHRVLMRLYADVGRRGAALRQYQQCVSTLQRELGTEPDAATKALYGEILRARASRVLQDEVILNLEPGLELHRAVEPRLASSAGDVPGLEHRLIGRDRELAVLARALDDAHGGQGRVVAIIGEAGVGKTSLLAGFEAVARRRGARVLAGRCYESAEVLPFGPWAEAFRGDEEALRTGARTLPSIWQADLTRLFPEIATPGLPVTGDDRLRLFEAAGRLAEALAGAQPLLVTLEDVHWADEMSLRLLSFFARRPRSSAVLIVITCREEEMLDARELGGVLAEIDARGHLTRVNLEPLSRADTGVLVRALVRAGADEAALESLADQVWAIGEGNPFMVLEAL